MAGSGSVTIDWGDGTKPESFTLTTREAEYYHQYSYSGGRTITITGNVTYLDCGSCETLDISKNTALTHLSCHGYFKSLDVSKHTALTELSIEADLTSLDVSKNTKLEYLSVSYYRNLTSYCNLTSLDVSKCTKLEYLDCSGNNLTSLDVSKCTKLAYLGCYDNNLTSLDVSKCTKLAYLNCSFNKLSAAALNALFGTLHNNAAVCTDRWGCCTYDKWIYIGENPGSDDCDLSIAENKGWYVPG